MKRMSLSSTLQIWDGNLLLKNIPLSDPHFWAALEGCKEVRLAVVTTGHETTPRATTYTTDPKPTPTPENPVAGMLRRAMDEAMPEIVDKMAERQREAARARFLVFD